PPDKQPPTEQLSAGAAEEDQARFDNARTVVEDANAKLSVRITFAAELLKADWPEALQAVLELLDNSGAEGTCVPICVAIADHSTPKLEYVDALLKLLADADAPVRNHAAAALSRYEDPSVTERLVTLIRDDPAAMPTRIAAINAITQLTDSHQAASILISLLDADGPNIDSALFQALARVSGEDQGSAGQKWREWWARVSGMTQAQWLGHQLTLARQREKVHTERIRLFEERLASAYEQSYTQADNGAKQQKLKSYLSDAEEVIRLLAIDIIQREIGEGGRPSEEVAADLRSRLSDPAAHVRRGVLSVLAHLRESTDATAVIGLLENEQDVTVRLAAIITLGELPNPQANPVLLTELQRNPTNPACKLEAARSLGRLNTKGSAEDRDLSAVIAALKSEYDNSAPNSDLRAELVFAMASIADASFATTLVAHLQDSRVNVRARCVAGLRQIGERKHLDAILALVADADAGVRGEAASTIGALGSEDRHLSTLLGRLKGDTEPNTTVRNNVWESFKHILSTRPPAKKMNWIQQLADLPARQIELARDLEGLLDGQETPSGQLLEVHTLLATTYEEQSRYDESARYWRLVAGARREAADLTWKEAAIRQFQNHLRAHQYGPATEAATQFLDDDSEHFKPRLSDEIISHLVREQQAGVDEQIAQCLEAVRSDLAVLMDDEFKNRLSPFQPAVEQPAPENVTQEEPAPPPDQNNLNEAPKTDE
ncbi:MAG: HEAT repeat domain-containing protein, partial [Planctomycetes bacterium]|nr:HEAT repeat domain-containing protein [Planctomycetota bacterium]